eukprot:gene27615-7252_t
MRNARSASWKFIIGFLFAFPHYVLSAYSPFGTQMNTWKSGRATFFGQDGWSIMKGSCGFGDIRADEPLGWNVAAMADAMWDYPDACGRCLEVKCSPGTFTDNYGSKLDRRSACRDQSASLILRITDTCPCSYKPNQWSNKRWCCGDSDHIDMSWVAFERLAPQKWGVIKIQYREIDCEHQPQRLAEPSGDRNKVNWRVKVPQRDWPEINKRSPPPVDVFAGGFMSSWTDASWKTASGKSMSGMPGHQKALCQKILPGGAIAMQGPKGSFKGRISLHFWIYVGVAGTDGKTASVPDIDIAIGRGSKSCTPRRIYHVSPTQYAPRCTYCKDYWWRYVFYFPGFAPKGDPATTISNATSFSGCGGLQPSQLDKIEFRNRGNGGNLAFAWLLFGLASNALGEESEQGVLETFPMHIPSAKGTPSLKASAGHVKQYVGSVDELPNLKDALGSCSFEKEVIMITTTANNVDSAAQTMWMLGLRISARILRLGYNIMFLDTDLIIFDDPYNSHEANIGVMYIQNVAPNGPISWMFTDVPDRMLRWAENQDWVKNRTWPLLDNWQHLLWDQANFGDALISAIVGRPLLSGAWAFHHGTFNTTWFQMHAKMTHGLVKKELVRVTPEYSLLFKADYKARWAELHLPFSNASWPYHLGSYPFPEERGIYSKAWLEEVKVEGTPNLPVMDQALPPGCNSSFATTWSPGGCPVYDDPIFQEKHCPHRMLVGKRGSRTTGKGPKNGALARSPMCGPVETAAFFDSNMVASWMYRPRHSADMWDYRSPTPPILVGHMLYFPHEKRIYKNALKMTYGWYNWTLATSVKKGSIYWASTPSHPVPLVLAPTDSLIDRMSVMSKSQLATTLQNLMTAAHILGRALAHPPLPCAMIKRIAHEKPRPHNRAEHMYGACIDNGAGLLPPEFAYLLSTLPSKAAASGPVNTLYQEVRHEVPLFSEAPPVYKEKVYQGSADSGQKQW